MFHSKKILAVVPARGGSKGIPLKNLREIGGRSLVAWVGEVIAQCDWIDRAVVSTDHEGIAAEAEMHGIAAPFRRPESLSGDRIGDWDVLHHALQEVERSDGNSYDVILMLQPTSPFRRPEHLLAVVDMLLSGSATCLAPADEVEKPESVAEFSAEEGGFDAVWTVSPTDTKAHPLKQLTVDPATGIMEYYDSRGSRIVARQQLDTLYHRNGVAYAITRDCLVEQSSIMGGNPGALVIRDEVVNIDTELDLEWAEFLLDRGMAGTARWQT